MSAAGDGAILAAATAIVLWRRRRTRARSPKPARRMGRGSAHPRPEIFEIAMREINERVRGKIFQVGTAVILVAVALAIVVPKIGGASSTAVQTVGIVGPAPASLKVAVEIATAASHDRARTVAEPSLSLAKQDLRAGKIDMAVANGQILVKTAIGAKASSVDPTFARALAAYLGEAAAGRNLGLSPAQITRMSLAGAVPIRAVEQSPPSTTTATTTIGIVLIFYFLSQYCTWILMGVMQEKSSRVVEVLLATVRPIQLLGGKILGIGLVALGQATLIVLFALGVERATGSSLLSGTQPAFLVAALLWLVLGYAFYCWLFAAAGSTASRQDQVQTLVLPLSIPMVIGYIFSVTVAVSGHASLLFKIIAYIPFTAPFSMPVLVSLGQAAWWQLLISAAISLATTAFTAFAAASIYRRAVLKTGERVRLRQLVGEGGRA